MLKAFVFPDDCTSRNFEKSASVSRIFLGILLTHRHIDLILGSPVSDSISIESLSALAGSILVALGLFTPLSLPVTAFLDYSIVWNLGSRLIILTGLIIWLGNGWKYYSLDRMLISSLLRPIGPLYKFSNSITYTPQTIRTLGLLIWGGMTLTSASFHINDEAWLKGYAVIHLLRTPFYNDFYELFYLVDTQLLLILSKLSCYLMMTWQAALWALPGIKIIRNFSFVMGLLFFLSSILFINISYLPFTELVFWILIYLPNSLWLGWEDSYTRGVHAIESISSGVPLQAAARQLKRFIKYNIIISFVIFNAGNTVRLFAGESSKTRALIDNILLNNKFYRRWNSAWGQAPLDDFNSNDLFDYRFSVVGCREYTDSTTDLVPWEDLNGGRLKYLRNDKFFMRVSVPFKQSTKTRSWNLREDKAIILRKFRALSTEIADFDIAATKDNPKIRAHTFYLIEHFVKFQDSLPVGWSTDNESLLLAEFKIPRSTKESTSNFKYAVPPGHLFVSKRIERTSQRYCM